MKASNLKKLVLAVALTTASYSAAAVTVCATCIPDTMTVDLWNGSQKHYTNQSFDTAPVHTGDAVGDGFDRWLINLYDFSGLVANFSNSTDTLEPYSYLQKAVLTDTTNSSNTWTALAINDGAGTSTIKLFVNQIGPGSFWLDIYGDSGVGSYSGDISAVPLPGAALLFGSVLLGAGALRRKQAKAGEMAAV